MDKTGSINKPVNSLIKIFTVHQPLFEGENIDHAMRLAADFLLPQMTRA